MNGSNRLFAQHVLTVFELNEYVRKSLAQDPMLRAVQIRGEISNMKRYPSGHWYFSLKDENARINCVMFRQNNFLVGKPPVDGESLVLTGNVSLYSKDGSYQFYVEELRRDGVGELYARFMELKEKLEKQGYFDPSIKKPVPVWPKKIGIITSPKGAVVHDIQTVANRRNPNIPLVLYPVKVQGDGAAEEIVQAIDYFNRSGTVNVIILGRGGGSIEDLWAFNSEHMAMAIVKSSIPIISAVGHETDFTIADFVADCRAATPSQAAEIAVTDRREWLGALADAKTRMANAMQMNYYASEQRLRLLSQRLIKARPDMALLEKEKRLNGLKHRLEMAGADMLSRHTQRLNHLSAKLTALSPNAVLKRGYAIAYYKEKAVTEAQQLEQGDLINLMFFSGSAQAKVEEVTP